MLTRNQRRKMTEATVESPIKILPKELLLEILSRIELSNLLQLRCVCKSWKSLIVDSQFTKIFLNRLFAEIADLSSKGKQHIQAFKSQLLIHNPVIPQQQQQQPEQEQENDGSVEEEKTTEVLKIEATEMPRNKVTERLMKKITEIDTILGMVRTLSGSGNVENIEEGMIALKDRIKLLICFVQISFNSVASSKK